MRGIFFLDQRTSIALIFDPASGEKSYHTGDQVAGAAKIAAIHADRVILSRNGRFETLALPRKELHQNPSDIGARKKARSQQAIPRMKRVWQRFQERPESILEWVRLDPAFSDGKFAGVTISPGKDKKFFAQFGLRKGDIVTWVNGVALTDPLKGMAVLGQLSQADTVSIRVRRGSGTHAFTFHKDGRVTKK